MGLRQKLLGMYAYWKIFYWYAFMGVVQAFFAWDRKIIPVVWCRKSFEYLGIRLDELADSRAISQGKTLFLANHRCQGDFFIHTLISLYKASFLSRVMVGVVMPHFWLFCSDICWFFRRTGSIDKSRFNSWLDTKFMESYRPSLLVYPEGHRRTNAAEVTQQEIKNGMIKFAFQRQIPIQLLMSFGNEKVINEKNMHIGWNQTVMYSFSEVINPKDFESEGVFVQEVSRRFIEFFNKVKFEYDRKHGTMES